MAERSPKGEIRPSGRKLRFKKLLPAIVRVHRYSVADLAGAGRQRARAKPRAQLAYLARAWSSMKATEITRRLHRDASMVSRLCASYEADRDARTENQIAALIDKQVTTHA